MNCLYFCVSPFAYMSQQIIYRILDANLDRAREALRTIEEWCRFGLEEVNLCDRCKHMRQELAQWHKEEFRRARNTPDDPATGLSHANESVRADVQAVLRANMGRLQEALRVLEEYSKVVDLTMGEAMKQMRYQVYTLESQLLTHEVTNIGEIRRQKLQAASLYLVTMPVENIVSVVKSALQGGVQIVQYRQKDGEDGTRYAIAQQLCEICHKYDALFLVNDRVDIAIAVGEAFDKIAKMLGLPYPGGPSVEREAAKGDPERFDFPRPLQGRQTPDFSLSGLKTAVRLVAERIAPLSDNDVADLCASFQAAIVDVMVDRTRAGLRACKTAGIAPSTLVVAGGVAANQAIRAGLSRLATEAGLPMVAPPLNLCGDNGAMIAWAGLERLKLGLVDDMSAVARPRWPLDALAPASPSPAPAPPEPAPAS